MAFAVEFSSRNMLFRRYFLRKPLNGEFVKNIVNRLHQLGTLFDQSVTASCDR